MTDCTVQLHLWSTPVSFKLSIFIYLFSYSFMHSQVSAWTHTIWQMKRSLTKKQWTHQHLLQQNKPQWPVPCSCCCCLWQMVGQSVHSKLHWVQSFINLAHCSSIFLNNTTKYGSCNCLLAMIQTMQLLNTSHKHYCTSFSCVELSPMLIFSSMPHIHFHMMWCLAT